MAINYSRIAELYTFLGIEAVKSPVNQERIDEINAQLNVELPTKEIDVLKLAFDSISQAVNIVDLTGCLLFYNTECERLLGPQTLHEGGAERSRRSGFFLPDKKTPWPTEQLPLERVLRGGSNDYGSLMYIQNKQVPEGKWIMNYAYPLRQPDGVLVGGIAILKQILSPLNQQKIGEINKQLSIELDSKDINLLKLAFDSISQAVIIVDLTGCLLFYNTESVRLFGPQILHESGAERARRSGFFLPDQETPWPTEQLPVERVLKGSAHSGSLMFVKNNQVPEGMWIMNYAYPLRQADGVLVGCIALLKPIVGAAGKGLSSSGINEPILPIDSP